MHFQSTLFVAVFLCFRMAPVLLRCTREALFYNVASMLRGLKWNTLYEYPENTL